MTTQIVGLAVIHSLWQGGLIAAAVAVIFMVARGSSASFRYKVGYAGLILMAVVPIVTVLGVARPIGAPSTESPGAAPAVPGAALTAPGESDAVTRFSEQPAAFEPAVTDQSGFAGRMTVSPRTADMIAIAWIIGLVIASIRLVGGLSRTRRLTREGTAPARKSLAASAAALAGTLGLGRTVRILESVRIDVPLVVGVLRPVIVIPASLLTSVAPWQIDMLIAHELAHVKRFDFLANLVQTVVETLLFYHPAARWLSERIRDERENCCDDIAVATCGGNARAYTETLLALEESRMEGIQLAAAANGGSLLRRARRLLAHDRGHIELGPRWIAGVLTLAAALLTGREAMGSVHSSLIPVAAQASSEEQDPKPKTKARRGDPDPSRAAPSRVERAPANAPLAERVRWAASRAEALGEGRYWVGYVVEGWSDDRIFYSDEIPVRFGESTMLSGHLQMKDDSGLGEARFFGVPLVGVAGPHPERSIAIFALINRRTGAIERVRSGTFKLPVFFDRRPVFWLGSAPDAESINFLRPIMSRVTLDGRPAVVAAVGAHKDSRVVVPVLAGWLKSQQPDDLRSETADWLARHGAIGLLSSTARNDGSEEVRQAAIGAFGRIEGRAATDSLLAFSSSLRGVEDKRAAIEALAHSDEPAALPGLVRIARTDASAELRGHAAEAISMHGRGEGSVDILTGIARTDRDRDVRVRAIHSIAQAHDPRSVGNLRALAMSSMDEDLQKAAVEALAHTVDDAAAMSALRGIADSHPSDAVRARAYESLVTLREHMSKDRAKSKD